MTSKFAAVSLVFAVFTAGCAFESGEDIAEQELSVDVETYDEVAPTPAPAAPGTTFDDVEPTIPLAPPNSNDDQPQESPVASDDVAGPNTYDDVPPSDPPAAPGSAHDDGYGAGTPCYRVDSETGSVYLTVCYPES